MWSASGPAGVMHGGRRTRRNRRRI
jgi:hypothetical protein